MRFNRKSRLSISVLVIAIIFGLIIGLYIYLITCPINTIDIEVDFDNYYLFQSSNNKYVQQQVLPVYNTLNIWDVDWFLDPVNNASNYKNKYYFIDRLIIMTATGGRSTGSNKFLTILENGTISYNFTKLGLIIDWLKTVNITPVFVIGNTPIDLTQNKDNIDYGAFDANTCEPINYTIYYNYIKALVQYLIGYGGMDFIKNWTFRIYTEPDNDDWLIGELDAYFRIYNVSARAIREVIPDARLELGNMMRKKLTSTYMDFIKKIDNEIPELFPDVIGWSVYGNINKDLFMRNDFADIRNWRQFLRDIGRGYVEFVIEEGQILIDENNKRLWGGDSTEVGAAFTANVFKTCLYENITRYTTWKFYSSELRTPKLNVIDMFMKMKGEKLVNLNLKYKFWTLISKKTIDGLASISNSKDCAHVLVYNLINKRDYENNITIKLNLRNLPNNFSHLKIYLIDKYHSNFHKDWDLFSKNFTYIQNENYNDGSKYDVDLGVVLAQEYRDIYYLWSWEHRFNYTLEQIFSIPLQISQTNEYKIEFALSSNSVILFEFD
ncbi:MAG: GH39 family glycosyl hydrolase [Promethearchaeota archaeon]